MYWKIVSLNAEVEACPRKEYILERFNKLLSSVEIGGQSFIQLCEELIAGLLSLAHTDKQKLLYLSSPSFDITVTDKKDGHYFLTIENSSTSVAVFLNTSEHAKSFSIKELQPLGLNGTYTNITNTQTLNTQGRGKHGLNVRQNSGCVLLKYKNTFLGKSEVNTRPWR